MCIAAGSRALSSDAAALIYNPSWCAISTAIVTLVSEPGGRGKPGGTQRGRGGGGGTCEVVVAAQVLGKGVDHQDDEIAVVVQEQGGGQVGHLQQAHSYLRPGKTAMLCTGSTVFLGLCGCSVQQSRPTRTSHRQCEFEGTQDAAEQSSCMLTQKH